MCECKLDTGSGGNVMPIRMYKLHFLQTNIDALNKSIKKETVLCAYNNSFIPQMGLCHIAMIN